MAIKFFDCNGYGQIEPNQVSFTRDGRIEAQCELDPEVFASNFPMTPAEAAAGKIYGENGAFLMVDKVNKIATVPSEALSDKGFPMGINYSTEMIYNQFTPGRRNFCMICGEFLPRIGFTEVGERITTNAVAWDSSVYPQKDSKEFYTAIKDDLAGGQVIYACVVEGSNGRLTIGVEPEDALGNVYAQVVKAYTNADGTLAFMFEFINKPATV